MIVIPVVLLFLVIVFALIMGRKHPSALIAVFALLAGVYIGRSSLGPPIQNAVTGALHLFG